MFTGIIETLGKITALETEKDNLHLTIQSAITSELKIDQSVAHNGVCLTVVVINDDEYTSLDNYVFNNSMWNWYATPNTKIPNDQAGFAEYCYGDMISCKENNALACTQDMPPHWINGTN